MKDCSVELCPSASNPTLVTEARATGVHREGLQCRVVPKRFRYRNPARDSTYDLLEMLSMPNLVGLQSMEAKGSRQVSAAHMWR